MANKFSTNKLRDRKVSVKLVGGPFSGHTLKMSSPGTLEFNVGSQKGRYDRNGYWVES